LNVWVLIVLAVILATLIYSLWEQISYAIVASIACAVVFIIEIATNPSAGTVYDIAFAPSDLVDPARMYTVLTSMYAHSPSGIGHIFFNLLALIFLGMALEQRIGTTPFVGIYLVSGLCGTLAFAFSEWGNPVAAVGASGAISGVLGAFARLFPRERMSFILYFIPLPPMPVWIIVIIFVGIQFLWVGGDPGSQVAWQAHLGGLAGGILFAPVVVKALSRKRVKRAVSSISLRRIATTPELRDIYHRIEREEIPDVRSAWIEELLSKARCPTCGSPVRATSEGLICKKGHLL
jgi:membrane associated rhomboid family serine protease